MSSDMAGFSQASQNVFTTSAQVKAYRKAVLDSGPVAYWPLDASGASVVGGSSFTWVRGGNVGISSGGGLFAGGLSSTFFSSSPSTVQIPFTTALTAATFSIEFFISYGHSSNTVLFECNGNSGYSIQLVDTSPWFGLQMNFGGSSSPMYYTTTNITKNNAPHHIVMVTASTTSGQIYVDGAAVSTTSTGTFAPSYAGAPFYLGSRNGLFGANASISDLAYYPYALSASQVAAHYAARQ